MVFSEPAEAALGQLASTIPHLKQLITHMLQCDPRPAYYQEKPIKKRFGTRIYDLDIKWECRDHTIIVAAIEPE